MDLRPGQKGEATEALRAIPSVRAVLDEYRCLDPDERSDGIVGAAVREVIDQHRRSLQAGRAVAVDARTLAVAARERVDRLTSGWLRPAINATGILLHTGLGRSPMPVEAVEAVRAAAGGYAPVELDLETGARGQRSRTVEPALRALTGAEAGIVVNNAAGALMLAVAALASGRSVAVSRGELIEIGGSFRLPEVIAAGGATPREVGTTNKTRLSDYRRALDDGASMLLKAHPSNYRIEGFTESVSIGALSSLGDQFGTPVVHDAGSGVLTEAHAACCPGQEPVVAHSVRDGAGLVLFSGDKLLGGPQCGIVVGSRELVDRLRRHPMMRALRVDKLTLAGLGAVLALHMEPERARGSIPVLAAIAEPVERVRARADRVAAALSEVRGLSRVGVVQSEAYAGGGASPQHALASFAVELEAAGIGEHVLVRLLRAGPTAVIGRVRAGAVALDMRSIGESLVEELVEVVRGVCESVASGGESL